MNEVIGSTRFRMEKGFYRFGERAAVLRRATTLFLATALRMLSTVSLRTLLLAVRSLSSTPEPKLLVWL